MSQALALRTAIATVTYEDRLQRFLDRLGIDHPITHFTGCAWMTPRGVVYPVGYACHCDFT